MGEKNKLIEKRYELVNQLIELKTWQMSNPEAKAAQAIKELEDQLDELGRQIQKL